MSEQWPNDPGQGPPTAPTGAPPPAGGWPPAGPPTGPTVAAPGPPQTPAATSWPTPSTTWPPPSAPTPSPDGDRDRSRQGLLFAAIVVAIALVAAGVTWLGLRAGTADGDEVASPPSTTTAPTTAPTDPGTSAAPPTTAAPVDPAAVAAEVLELQAFVEVERGLAFQQDVVVEVLDDAAFEERLLAEVDAQAEAIELQQRMYAALGLIEPGTDLVAAQRQLLSQGVLGWYDPATDELVVRGTELTPYTRQTIVHELVHALDDQWFELDRPAYEERDDEVGAGLLAVVEGDANRIEDAWVATLSPDEAEQRLQEEARFALEVDVRGVPTILLELMAFPYEDGRFLVDELVALRGQDGVDDALVEPPTSTEQVLLPDAYLTGEAPLAVPVPDAAGEVVDDGTFGMLMTNLLLEEAVLPSEAWAGAEGWAGDAYVAWETPDGATCVRVETTVDSPTDVLELLEGLGEYAASRPNVDVAQIGPLEVRLEGCTDSSVSGGGADPS